MTQVARSKPVTPASEAEERLLAAVEVRYGNVVEFGRQVAARTGRSPDAEKRAFYRIVNGGRGDMFGYRLGKYTELLGEEATALLAAPPASEVDEAGLPALARLERLEGDLADVLLDQAREARRVTALQARVRRLETRSTPDQAVVDST